MSLPGGTGFSGKQFWGIQLKPQSNSKEKQVRVNSDTELHISKVLVDFGFLHKPHEANCSVSVGVRYETDRCDCDVTKQSCGLHQQQQSCVLCVIKPEKESEADLDLNFLGGKDLTFYCSCNCDCGNVYDYTVNISGYVVRG